MAKHSVTDDLRMIIRQKIVAGMLPKDRLTSIAVGFLPPKACDGCGLTIERTLVGYELTMPDGRYLRLHRWCLTIWHEERARLARSS